jgi:hypothetical protein
VRSQALAGLLRRIEQTGRIASGRFPVFADPRSGEWTRSDDGAWSSGFWPGMLWLAEAATGEGRFAALESARRLRGRTGTPTVLRGFVFWYGAGIAAVLDPDRHAQAELAIAAARSLAADFDPATGLLPPGTQDARLYGWPRPGACIDGPVPARGRLGNAIGHLRPPGPAPRPGLDRGLLPRQHLGPRAGLGDARAGPGRPPSRRGVHPASQARRRLGTSIAHPPTACASGTSTTPPSRTPPATPQPRPSPPPRC